MKPDAGSVLVDGEDITKINEKGLYCMVDKFGLVFQGGALFDSLTVGENVAFGIKNRKDMKRADIDAIIEHSLNQVGLADIADLLPAELSGGMKKRVAIARVIAKKPAIIMYDEPTTGLDPIMADIINDLIIKVGGNKEITSIVITHDMISAYKISDKIAVLFEGRIIETGSPAEIKAHPEPDRQAIHRRQGRRPDQNKVKI